jgi:aspartate aminotransferase
VTASTRAIILNSPCNPTGAVYRREELRQIGELAVERDLLVVADEVYEKIVFGAEHVSIASLDQRIAARTVTVNSVSKTHSMTGWRIGYAAMPAELAAKVTELQSLSTSGPCSISQRAAIAALAADPAHVRTMVAQYAARREFLLDRLGRLEEFSLVPPEGTFYLFLNVAGLCGRQTPGHGIAGSDELAELLLREAGVKVISGTGFGSDVHVRISFAASMQSLEEGMARLEAWLARIFRRCSTLG